MRRLRAVVVFAGAMSAAAPAGAELDDAPTGEAARPTSVQPGEPARFGNDVIVGGRVGAN